MMGLLGNVAEVKHLRTHLMKEQYVNVFTRLLLSGTDGIEVRIYLLHLRYLFQMAFTESVKGFLVVFALSRIVRMKLACSLAEPGCATMLSQ